MTPNSALTVIDEAQVAPPENTTSATTLPFTFFDAFWVRLPNVNRLTFYHSPCSETHFKQTIIPNLKHSLSHALQHFYMLAGKLVVPSDKTLFPELRYEEGDSVSIMFARADSSVEFFNHLVADEPRKCIEFYPFVRKIESESSGSVSNSIVSPLLKLQVTLFPDVGICIGVTNHHTAGDANTIFRFVKAWATLARVGDGVVSLSDELVPLYDRTLVKDPKDLRKTWWDLMNSIDLGDAFSSFLPKDATKVRATFVFDSNTVKNLKSLALSKKPLERLSTFVVACAYVWTCMVKSRVATEDVDEEEAEHFGFVADCRARLDPPIPDNYFGNCLIYCVSTATVKELIGEGGFVLAVEQIAKSIKERLYNKDGVLSDAENWFKNMGGINMKRMVGVAGSPKYNYYDLDFGFGVGRKFEFVSIDEQGSIALSGLRDGGEGIEVGLTFPQERMNAFIAKFNDGLKGLHL